MNKYIFTGAIGFVLTTFLHFFTNFDITMQKLFFHKHQWLIDGEEPFARFWFYQMPKGLVALLGVLLIAWLIKKIKNKEAFDKCNGIMALSYLLLFPWLTNVLKSHIPQFCPRDSALFLGPYVGTFFEALQAGMHCYPGAHASTGMAFASMYFLVPTNNKKWSVLGACSLCQVLGLYQVFRGAHFITDNVATMFFGVFFLGVMIAIRTTKGIHVRPHTGTQGSLRRQGPPGPGTEVCL